MTRESLFLLLMRRVHTPHGGKKAMDYAKESLKMHYELRGKLEVTSRAAVDTKDALSLAYTPGVAAPDRKSVV